MAIFFDEDTEYPRAAASFGDKDVHCRIFGPNRNPEEGQPEVVVTLNNDAPGFGVENNDVTLGQMAECPSPCIVLAFKTAEDMSALAGHLHRIADNVIEERGEQPIWRNGE